MTVAAAAVDGRTTSVSVSLSASAGADRHHRLYSLARTPSGVRREEGEVGGRKEGESTAAKKRNSESSRNSTEKVTATVKHDEKGPTEKWLPQISTTRTLVKMQIMKMQKYS